MFRIRRIFDDTLPEDRLAMEHIRELLIRQFPDARQGEFDHIARKLRDPVSYGGRSVIFVAEGRQGLQGLAWLIHFSDANSGYLDYLAVTPGRMGHGVGGALYTRVHREIQALGCVGLFLECLADTQEHCHNKDLLSGNRRRIRFYLNHGARVIVGTKYEKPLSLEPGQCPPSLLFHAAEKDSPLRRDEARATVAAILERKYRHLCTPDYVKEVVESFKDDPVKLRPVASRKVAPVESVSRPKPLPRLALVVSDGHEVHHVRERGSVEAPARLPSLLKGLLAANDVERLPVRRFPDRWLKAVHDPGLLNYLKQACSRLKEKEVVYPYVFPLRNKARPPKELPLRAGYYCMDTFTPLSANAWPAARMAADCALTAAQAILDGHMAAYALVRPPGHHAERLAYGGFCYLNNAALAAEYLSRHGKVAVLDLDYHHGNGTQDIFYERSDVLTLSIHGHPSFAFPYFSGFADERGEGQGRGANWNAPLPEQVDGQAYRAVLSKALDRIQGFNPDFLIVPLGMDTARGDPTGSWSLTAEDFRANGRLVAGPGLPVLVVQEGGYRTPALGRLVRGFFLGLSQGLELKTLKKDA